jgi:uncharacterized protein (TIGR01777 family)
MKIVIPGGTGQVGTFLARALVRDGHDVVILSRGKQATGPGRIVSWDASSLGEWKREFEGADAVINLAGRNVNCRYTRANRKRIMESRVDATSVVGEAILQCRRPPKVWLQASTATIYAHRFDAPNDEKTGIIGGSEEGAPDSWRFSTEVAKSWERTARAFTLPATRLVLLRSAIAFNPDPGSAFDILLRLVRFRLGGTAGSGQQFVSWIHEADFVRAILWIIEDDAMSGPVNLAAPNPLPNDEFMRILRDEWGTRVGLPASGWLLSIGAALIRTETELILKSRRVVPGLLLERGFKFDFPTWRPAASDLCVRWRLARGVG